MKTNESRQRTAEALDAQFSRLRDLVNPLIDWYQGAKRDLAWRGTRDPYAIWVSEIMLQQTRVEAVKAYYDRFMRALATVEALADCDPDRLNKLWEGLGYYSRVRSMQHTAQIIKERYGGKFPRTAAVLETLPGIGAYTSAAVASIAFDERIAVVDGNVMRVVSRIACVDEDATDVGVKKAVQTALNRVIPTNAGTFNQAMMELGAVVCIPNGTPLCASCPVAAQCRAGIEGVWSAYPVLPPKKARKLERRTVMCVIADGKIALRKRGEALLHGLWEFPTAQGSLTAEQVREELTARGFTIESIVPLGEVKHIFTHIEWHMTGYAVIAHAQSAQYVYATAAEVGSIYAIPSAYGYYKKKMGL